MQITHEQYTRIYAEVYSDLACNARVQARRYVEGLKPTEVYETVSGILSGWPHATDNFPKMDEYTFEQSFEEAWLRFAGEFRIEDKGTREVMGDMRQALASPAALKAYMQEAVRYACYERVTRDNK